MIVSTRKVIQPDAGLRQIGHSVIRKLISQIRIVLKVPMHELKQVTLDNVKAPMLAQNSGKWW